MSTPQRRNYDSSVMPPELIQIILQSLNQSDLFKICALSRNFNKEVMRALYYHIDLAHGTIHQCISFIDQISQHPDTAQQIRELSLPFVFQTMSLSQDDLTAKLPSAMKSMKNLTSLYLGEGHLGAFDSTYNNIRYHLDGNLFLGCAFRLKTFRGTWHPDVWGEHATANGWLSFLLEQNQIQDLEASTMFYLKTNPSIPFENLLPDLSIISTRYGTGHSPFLPFTVLASRRLTRLKLEMNTQGDAESALQALTHAPASATMTHLDFHCKRMEIWVSLEAEHVQALDSICRAMPNLQFLRYSAVRLEAEVSV